MKGPTQKTHEGYLNPSISVDIVIFTIKDNSLNVLLINRLHSPFKGAYAVPGGFILENETSKDAASRILRDKAGVGNVYLEQLYTFDDPDRDPRGPVFSLTYFALVNYDEIDQTQSTTLQTPQFIPVKKLPSLAFDHRKIITYAIERLQSKIEYTNVVYSLLPQLFTFTELQKVYEIILDKKLDKRNFRKKFTELNLLEKTKLFSRGKQQRPAQLYKFKHRKPTSLRKFF